MVGEDGQKLKPLVLGLGIYFFSFLKIPSFFIDIILLTSQYCVKELKKHFSVCCRFLYKIITLYSMSILALGIGIAYLKYVNKEKLPKRIGIGTHKKK
jgi:hypothetical protein